MNPLYALKLSDETVSLSDALIATLSIDGLAPLVVTPPLPLLAEASRQSWQIKPQGPASVSKLLDGQERWTQAYRLEPFVSGDKVSVEFAPVPRRQWGDFARVCATAVEVGDREEVRSPKALMELRAITGPETLPPIPDAYRIVDDAADRNSCLRWFCLCLRLSFGERRHSTPCCPFSSLQTRH